MSNLQVQKTDELPVARVKTAPTAMELLQGVMAANNDRLDDKIIGIVKELRQMVNEERSFNNKVAFNKAFFALRQDIQTMDVYADKQAKTDSGGVAYTYCSEREISEKLEPVLFAHGFTMMFGQEQDGERTSAVITLVHCEGHEETRKYAVRSGNTNRMKDATAADTGATTSAWRHLCIKWFGLKSRIKEGDDPRNLGGFITKAQADEFRHRLTMLNSNHAEFLKIANADSFEAIYETFYPILNNLLTQRERRGK